LSHVTSAGEALRKAPGIHVRDEEGLSLRPNIGVRGLSPTRSTTVLLLEDGIPFTIAPYGDNASYYHPPIGRFDHVEVLKGSGQILFGPRTIGGVINYVTPVIPTRAGGRIGLEAGNRSALALHARFGGTWEGTGLLLDVSRRQGEGARENVGSLRSDATLKTVVPLGRDQSLLFKASYYAERSRVTYSGLTETEWAAAPRQNPFRNDSMLLDRTAAAATHRAWLGAGVALTTTAYAYRIGRDWWRQASNSAERPNDASDPDCAGMANLNTTCGNQGRLRDYAVTGLEPRLQLEGTSLGLTHQIELGVRVHHESQDRRQVNGDFPAARTVGSATDANSGIVEDNLRRNTAYSGFLQHRVLAGRWSVTPGLRIEHVRYDRVNRRPVPTNPEGIRGRTSLTQLIPGIGATFAASAGTTFFAGMHRGFAPPRTEDLISNSTGGIVELDSELSWNYEAGVRSQPATGLSLEATAFRMAFSNQIIPASIAGGTGAALTSAGRTLHQGLELAGSLGTASLLGWRHDLSVNVSYTWLPTVRFEGERFSFVGQGAGDVIGKVYADQNAAGTRQRVRVTGNRLPYAPEHLLTASLGWVAPQGFDFSLEAVHLGQQFGDPLNTLITVPDGQQGLLPAATIWNLAANYNLPGLQTALFVTLKNATDKLYIVDRTRGLLPGAPRLVQVGATTSF
jgi:Fe(3+) dicitrate transport protein